MQHTKRKINNRATKQHFSLFLSPTFCNCSGLLLHLITLMDTQSVGLPSRRNRPAVEATYAQNTLHPHEVSSVHEHDFQKCSQE